MDSLRLNFPSRVAVPALAAVLLVMFAGFCYRAAGDNSVAMDEPGHILAGYSYRSGTGPEVATANLRATQLWLGLPLLVFFLSRSRLPLYLLPLFVPISLLVAMALARVPMGRGTAALAGLWLVFLLTVKVFVSTMPSQQDARQLADEIRPLLPATPSEMVFVQTKARYGLRFYLASEVESISLEDLGERSVAATGPFDDDLRHELAEGEPGVYYLVPKSWADEFEGRVASRRLGLQRLGEVRGLGVYSVESAPANGRLE